MSIFKNMNRKERREFDKLPNDKKGEIIHAEIVNQVSPILQKRIAKAMVNGMKLEREQLYQKYLTKIENEKKGSKAWYNAVDELFSYIRVGHVEWEKAKAEDKSESDSK